MEGRCKIVVLFHSRLYRLVQLSRSRSRNEVAIVKCCRGACLNNIIFGCLNKTALSLFF